MYRLHVHGFYYEQRLSAQNLLSANWLGLVVNRFLYFKGMAIAFRASLKYNQNY